MLALSSGGLSPTKLPEGQKLSLYAPRGDRRSSWETEPVPGKCLKALELGDSPSRELRAHKLSQHTPPTDLRLFIKALTPHCF